MLFRSDDILPREERRIAVHRVDEQSFVGIHVAPGILPHDAEQPFALSPSLDKQLVRVEASHYCTRTEPPFDAPMHEVAGLVADWAGAAVGYSPARAATTSNVMIMIGSDFIINCDSRL